MQSSLDFLIRLLEVTTRQVYWRLNFLQKLYKINKSNKVKEKYLDLNKLKTLYTDIGISRGTNLMVHSKIEGLVVLDDNNQPLKPLNLSNKLIEMFQELIGLEGTLAMPTHPLYKEDQEFMSDKRKLTLTYDIKRTPSKVGLLTEVFRRRKDVIRSRHPLSSLSALGPQAKFLTNNNINDKLPLPHGLDSGYYRFSKINGKIVSLNIPLIKALSIVHCPEEIKDTNWPVKDFFYERRFVLKEEGVEKEITVREKDPRWVRFISLKQLQRDLVREGILKEHLLDGIRVDIADAQEVINYMNNRNKNSTYPYFFIPSIFYK